MDKYKMAVVLLDDGAVLGYCPKDFYIYPGDRVEINGNGVVWDNHEGIVATVENYVSMDDIINRAESTGLPMLKIASLKKTEEVDWEGYDE